MSAGKYDLYVEQGATLTVVCYYKDSTGTPINLTGMTMAAQIRRSYSDPTIAANLSVIIADQTVSQNIGKFTVGLTSTESAAIPVVKAIDFETPPTNYAWDVELNTGTQIKRLMMGTCFVSPEVTR